MPTRESIDRVLCAEVETARQELKTHPRSVQAQEALAAAVKRLRDFSEYGESPEHLKAACAGRRSLGASS